MRKNVIVALAILLLTVSFLVVLHDFSKTDNLLIRGNAHQTNAK